MLLSDRPQLVRLVLERFDESSLMTVLDTSLLSQQTLAMIHNYFSSNYVRLELPSAEPEGDFSFAIDDFYSCLYVNEETPLYSSPRVLLAELADTLNKEKAYVSSCTEKDIQDDAAPDWAARVAYLLQVILNENFDSSSYVTPANHKLVDGMILELSNCDRSHQLKFSNLIGEMPHSALLHLLHFVYNHGSPKSAELVCGWILSLVVMNRKDLPNLSNFLVTCLFQESSPTLSTGWLVDWLSVLDPSLYSVDFSQLLGSTRFDFCFRAFSVILHERNESELRDFLLMMLSSNHVVEESELELPCGDSHAIFVLDFIGVVVRYFHRFAPLTHA
ncbi:uncharacterized protein LOC135121815 [Zophobas morio]|uniref:uncharacterized protein LOC135121815 n=1 Tax=Zophobas morio TaxID=2755281 RepID=UPI003082D1F4